MLRPFAPRLTIVAWAFFSALVALLRRWLPLAFCISVQASRVNAASSRRLAR